LWVKNSLFYGEVKIDANDKYHPIPFPSLDPVKDSWGFLKVWIDPMQSQPYMLLLMGDKAESCSIFDPAEGWLIKGCGDYEEARLWLLEDQYEPIEGRLASDEIR
jgi:hypothetical protein